MPRSKQRGRRGKSSKTPRKATLEELGDQLIEAAKLEDAEQIKNLIKQGARVDHSNEETGLTALHYAAAVNNIQCVKTLIKNHANINARMIWGFSVLHTSARMGSTDIVQLLCDHGADISAKDDDARTPYDVAKEYGHIETAHLLQQLSAQKADPPKEEKAIEIENKSTKANKNECTRCQCRDCLGKDNQLNNLITEKADMRQTIKIMEKENAALKKDKAEMLLRILNLEEQVTTLQEQDTSPRCAVPLVLTTMAGLDQSDMYGKDYMSPLMQRVFSKENHQLFQNHLDPQGVIDHLWSKQMLSETQRQEINSLTTDVGKANYIWSWMKQRRRNLMAVREALRVTLQNPLADHL